MHSCIIYNGAHSGSPQHCLFAKQFLPLRYSSMTLNNTLSCQNQRLWRPHQETEDMLCHRHCMSDGEDITVCPTRSIRLVHHCCSFPHIQLRIGSPMQLYIYTRKKMLWWCPRWWPAGNKRSYDFELAVSWWGIGLNTPWCLHYQLRSSGPWGEIIKCTVKVLLFVTGSEKRDHLALKQKFWLQSCLSRKLLQLQASNLVTW